MLGKDGCPTARKQKPHQIWEAKSVHATPDSVQSSVICPQRGGDNLQREHTQRRTPAVEASHWIQGVLWCHSTERGLKPLVWLLPRSRS